jgi:hypothetical protein
MRGAVPARSPDPGPVATALVIGAVATALVGTVAGVHAANPRALCSFHGFLHAGVVETLSVDRLPPENPFFAGRTICYYWAFHALGAMIARLTGLDALHALEIVGLAGLVVLVAASVDLGRRVWASLGRGVFLAVLALVGGGPLGPWIAIGRWLDRGGEFLPAQAAFPVGSYALTSTVGNVRYGPIFYFFFTQSSRAAALALLLAAVWALRRAHARPTPARLSMVVLAGALSTAMSPVIGIAGLGALGAAYLVRDGRAWLDSLRAATRPASAGAASAGAASGEAALAAGGSWRLVLCLAAGVLAALPTYYHLFLISQSGYAFVLFSRAGAKLVLSVVVGAGPVVFLARPGARRPGVAPSDGRLVGVVLTAGLLLLAAAMSLELPTDNNCNFYYAAMTILALPAAGYAGVGVRRSGAGRRRVEVAGLLLFALPLAFIAGAFSGREPIAISFEAGRINRSAADAPDLAAMYAWIRDRTPKEAIVVIDPDRMVAVSGNMPELPAMTGRPVFVGTEGYMTEPYAAYGQRRTVARQLLQGAELRPALAAALESLGRPIYLLHDAGASGSAGREALVARLGPPAFEAGRLSLFRWRLR